MSDEKFIELAESKGIEQFKSAEDLADAYLNLQKEYSARKPDKDSSTEDLLEKTAQFYDGAAKESELEGELKDISVKAASDTKVHQKLVDAVVAKVAGHISSKITNQNRERVTGILKDGSKKVAIEKALGSEDGVKTFNERYHKGLITREEADLLARLGSSDDGSRENPEGVSEPESAGLSESELRDELLSTLRDFKHPYFQKGDPLHKESVMRVNKLKKVLNIT